MCVNILTLDPKTGKVMPERRQCERCKAEGRRCRSREADKPDESKVIKSQHQ